MNPHTNCNNKSRFIAYGFYGQKGFHFQDYKIPASFSSFSCIHTHIIIPFSITFGTWNLIQFMHHPVNLDWKTEKIKKKLRWHAFQEPDERSEGSNLFVVHVLSFSPFPCSCLQHYYKAMKSAQKRSQKTNRQLASRAKRPIVNWICNRQLVFGAKKRIVNWLWGSRNKSSIGLGFRV